MLSGAFALGAYFGRGYWVIDAFFANVAAGFIGSLVTVALIERAEEQRRERERRAFERMALTSMYVPVVHLTQALGRMIKASTPANVERTPRTFDEQFSEQFGRHLDCLDLRGRTGIEPDSTGFMVLADRDIPRLLKQLSKIEHRYIGHLDVAFVRVIEAVVEDEYFRTVQQISAIMRSSFEELAKVHVLTDFAPLRRKCLERVAQLAREYQSRTLAPPDAFLFDFSAQQLPQLGSARFPDDILLRREER